MNTKTLLIAGAALLAYKAWNDSQAGGATGATSVASSPLMAGAITAGAAFAAYHYGNGFVKTAALGVLGLMAANQVPVVRDGLNVRLAA